MNYVDIRELSIYQGRLAVSIYILCNDRRGCINKINAMCLEAAAKVRATYTSEEGDALARKLESLHSRIPIESHIHSVVLFVNASIAWVYPLPYQTEDAIIVAKAFIFDDLIRHLGRALRYWVLVLFHEKPFLFDGYDDTILEISHRHGLAMGEEHIDMSDPAGRVYREKAIWGINCRYKDHQEFIQIVDKNLQHFIESDPLPLVCCADPASLQFFREYSAYADRMLLAVPIDQLYDREDLQMHLWPLVEKSHRHLQKEMLTRLKEACRAQLCARGIVEVWRAANQGRAQFICISRQYAEKVCNLPAASAVVISESCHDGVQRDGVDLLIELALRKGIPVCWYPGEELKEFSHVAAIVTSGDQEVAATT